MKMSESKKVKNLLLILIGVFLSLMPFKANAEVIPDYNDGNTRYSSYFYLEDLSGNKLDNYKLKLEKTDKSYTQDVTFHSDGLYSISEKFADNQDDYMFVITYKDEPIAGFEDGRFLKYYNKYDYSSTPNFSSSTKDVNISDYKKFAFKSIYDEYVTVENYIKDGTDVKSIDKDDIPVVVLNQGSTKPVVADKKDSGKVYISSVSLMDKTDGTKELKSPTINMLKVNFNMKFTNVSDSAKYQVVIKNDTDKDYKISSNNIKDKSGYINYEFNYDGDDIVKAGTEKTIFATVSYANEVPSEKFTQGAYEEDNTVNVQLSTGDGTVASSNDEVLPENPKTGIKDHILLILIITALGLIDLALLRRKYFKKLMVVTLCMLTIPISVLALDVINVDIDSHIEIDGNDTFCVLNEEEYLYNNENNEDYKHFIDYYQYVNGETFQDYIDGSDDYFDNYDKYSLDVKTIDETYFNRMPYDENIPWKAVKNTDKIVNDTVGCYLLYEESSQAKPVK